MKINLHVRLNGVSKVFGFGNVNDAATKIHSVAKAHGYSCLVNYNGDQPEDSWTLVRMADNHTVGRAYIMSR